MSNEDLKDYDISKVTLQIVNGYIYTIYFTHPDKGTLVYRVFVNVNG